MGRIKQGQLSNRGEVLIRPQPSAPAAGVRSHGMLVLAFNFRVGNQRGNAEEFEEGSGLVVTAVMVLVDKKADLIVRSRERIKYFVEGPLMRCMGIRS